MPTSSTTGENIWLIMTEPRKKPLPLKRIRAMAYAAGIPHRMATSVAPPATMRELRKYLKTGAAFQALVKLDHCQVRGKMVMFAEYISASVFAAVVNMTK